MKKGSYLLGTVVQAILFYKERFLSSSDTLAKTSADQQVHPELPAIIEQNYELLFWGALGRYANRTTPNRVIQLLDQTLRQVSGEGRLPVTSKEEMLGYLQYRISKTIELNLSNENQLKRKSHDHDLNNDQP